MAVIARKCRKDSSYLIVASFGIVPSMRPTMPSLAANHTLWSSMGAMARILRLSEKIGVMLTEVNVLFGSVEQDTNSKETKRARIKRMKKILSKVIKTIHTDCDTFAVHI